MSPVTPGGVTIEAAATRRGRREIAPPRPRRTAVKGQSMGRLLLLTMGIALGVTAAVLLAAYEARGNTTQPAEPGA